jgi:hypothetical protein
MVRIELPELRYRGRFVYDRIETLIGLPNGRYLLAIKLDPDMNSDAVAAKHGLLRRRHIYGVSVAEGIRPLFVRPADLPNGNMEYWRGMNAGSVLVDRDTGKAYLHFGRHNYEEYLWDVDAGVVVLRTNELDERLSSDPMVRRSSMERVGNVGFLFGSHRADIETLFFDPTLSMNAEQVSLYRFAGQSFSRQVMDLGEPVIHGAISPDTLTACFVCSHSDKRVAVIIDL